MTTYSPTITASTALSTPGSQKVQLTWTINYNGGSAPSNSITFKPVGSGTIIYSSSSRTGNVTVSALTPNTDYILTVISTCYYSIIGETVSASATSTITTSKSILTWNGTKFVAATGVKTWKLISDTPTEVYGFVNAASIKSNSVAGSSPTWTNLD